jgi:hypothetical protein
MVYITHQTPSAYWNRHGDWYQGWFRDVAHAVGLTGEYMYWVDCEQKASFAKSLCGVIPAIGGIVGDFIVSLFRSAYNSTYVGVYDNWAVSACKQLERFQGEIEAVPKKIQDQVEAAKAYIKSNLIDPIQSYLDNQLKPVCRRSEQNQRYDLATQRVRHAHPRTKWKCGHHTKQRQQLPNSTRRLQHDLKRPHQQSQRLRHQTPRPHH